jgi:hypothetical protein
VGEIQRLLRGDFERRGIADFTRHARFPPISVNPTSSRLENVEKQSRVSLIKKATRPAHCKNGPLFYG